ncbi:MAG: nucleotidyltransferase family protein [Patescibacteria group bacterium]
MKAIILAGGLGTRLRPLTNDTPKPLLPIQGRPIMEHAILNLKRHGIEDVILSIGYLSEKIKNYFGAGEKLGVNLSYFVETEPLGTGGAIKSAAAGIDEPVFVIWGDNLMDVNYTELMEVFLKYQKTLAMVLTPREDVEHFGVAKLEGDRVVAFVEKPARESAPSNLINAGAIVLNTARLAILPEGKSSIEYDFYEKLEPGEIVAHIHRGQWYPTDTMEKYRHADDNFRPPEL